MDSVLFSPKVLLPMLIFAVVVGLIKPEARLTVKNNAHRVGISSGSADKILPPQLKLREVCAWCTPIAWLKKKKATPLKPPIFLKIKTAKIATKYMMSSGCATKLCQPSRNNKKRGKSFVWLIFEFGLTHCSN